VGEELGTRSSSQLGTEASIGTDVVTMKLKGVLDGMDHCLFGRMTILEDFVGILVGIEGRIDAPQIDNREGCCVHVFGCEKVKVSDWVS
jgi:hypothetical protein